MCLFSEIVRMNPKKIFGLITGLRGSSGKGLYISINNNPKHKYPHTYIENCLNGGTPFGLRIIVFISCRQLWQLPLSPTRSTMDINHRSSNIAC